MVHFIFLLDTDELNAAEPQPKEQIRETVPQKLMTNGNGKINALFFDQSNVRKNIDVFFGSQNSCP